MKALGRGMSSMGFAEIEVARDEHGVPSVRAARRARRPWRSNEASTAGT